MLKTLPGVALLLFATLAGAASDIWVSLFRETLQQARRGDSEAQYNVGAMYQSGRGVKPDRERAIEWYGKAAAQGNPQAVSRLGLMQANQASFSTELQQAETGNVESQYNVGNMFTKGIGTDVDPGQAVHWYEKAAGQGHVKAAYKLGLARYEGSGVRKNTRLALKWFGVAAAEGYAPAQYYLGRIYSEGNGVRRNDQKALEWLTRAVDGGFDQARAEMIDVTERMKQRAARSKGKMRKKVTASSTPAEDGTGEGATWDTMDSLMSGNWNRDEQPVAWLPSAINNCRNADGRIVCLSEEQLRDSATNTIRFKTKSVISDFSGAGAFKVIYRNLVIDAMNNEPSAGEAVSAFDEAAPDRGFTVKTGWGKEHILECLFHDSHAVNCTKNRTHEMLITSQQQVADRE